MLPKRLRLPVQNAFKRRGGILRSSAFTLRVLPAERAASRFGIAVGRAALAKASARNKLRRIFFNAARRAARTLPCRDYLMLVAPAVSRLSAREAQTEIETLFREAAARATL